MQTADTWSEEKCLELIREFKARPILWDPRNTCFFKKKLKPVAWDEIAQTLNTTAEECKHKMGILMSSFRREKSKIVNSLKNNTDPSQVYKSTWFAFQDLVFLMDRNALKKRRFKETNNEDDDEEEDLASSVKKSLLQYYVQTPTGGKRKKRPPKISKFVTARPGVQSAKPESNVSKPEPGPSQAPDEREEEIKSFINFIGNKMKRYSDVTKNAVQQEICDIIFKADRNLYEDNNSENTEFATITVDYQNQNDDDPLTKSGRIMTKIEEFSDSE